MNKTMQTAVIGTIVGTMALGLIFKYGGSLPIVKDAREGLGG